MKAKRAKGWACAFCKKLYPDSEHGKLAANECCLCVECKTNQSEYTGRGTRCRQCHNAKELYSALENMEHAKRRLEKADKLCR